MTRMTRKEAPLALQSTLMWEEVPPNSTPLAYSEKAGGLQEVHLAKPAAESALPSVLAFPLQTLRSPTRGSLTAQPVLPFAEFVGQAVPLRLPLRVALRPFPAWSSPLHCVRRGPTGKLPPQRLLQPAEQEDSGGWFAHGVLAGAAIGLSAFAPALMFLFLR